VHALAHCCVNHTLRVLSGAGALVSVVQQLASSTSGRLLLVMMVAGATIATGICKTSCTVIRVVAPHFLLLIVPLVRGCVSCRWVGVTGVVMVLVKLAIGKVTHYFVIGMQDRVGTVYTASRSLESDAAVVVATCVVLVVVCVAAAVRGIADRKKTGRLLVHVLCIRVASSSSSSNRAG